MDGWNDKKIVIERLAYLHSRLSPNGEKTELWKNDFFRFS
jgi:hypothetical protein